MARLYLGIDCNFLCNRAFHVFGNLSADGQPTGVIYGFLRDIMLLHNAFGSQRFLFCFDHWESLRKKISPVYKSRNNPKWTSEREREHAIEDKNILNQQIATLQSHILPRLGFRNIFQQPGYEADDLLAKCCDILKEDEEIILVSSDRDLYQLLDGTRVSIWNPGTNSMYGESRFRKQYNLDPQQWVEVKAIAGENATRDNIPGVFRVGEATAASYVRGTLPKKTKTYPRIEEWVNNDEGYKINLQLIRLPLEGACVHPFIKDKFSQNEWNNVCKELKMNTLVGKFQQTQGTLYGEGIPV